MVRHLGVPDGTKERILNIFSRTTCKVVLFVVLYNLAYFPVGGTEMNGWDRYLKAELAVYTRMARNGDEPDDLRAVRPIVIIFFIALVIIGFVYALSHFA